MTPEQKQAHEKLLNSLPSKTHYKHWPESMKGKNQSVKCASERGRKGARKSIYRYEVVKGL